MWLLRANCCRHCPFLTRCLCLDLTQKTVLSCERILIPCHVNKIHWTCILVDLRGRRLRYFDSLNVSTRSKMLMKMAR